MANPGHGTLHSDPPRPTGVGLLRKSHRKPRVHIYNGPHMSTAMNPVMISTGPKGTADLRDRRRRTISTIKRALKPMLAATMPTNALDTPDISPTDTASFRSPAPKSPC